MRLWVQIRNDSVSERVSNLTKFNHPPPGTLPMTDPLTLPLQITTESLFQIRAIMAEKNIASPEYGLRIGMQGGGCGGASFLLGFDKQKPNDHIYRVDELEIYIEKKHLMYLIGLQLDFEDGDNGRGFTFNNPLSPTPTPA